MELGNSVKYLIRDSVRGSNSLLNNSIWYSVSSSFENSVWNSVWFPVKNSIRNLKHLK